MKRGYHLEKGIKLLLETVTYIATKEKSNA